MTIQVFNFNVRAHRQLLAEWERAWLWQFVDHVERVTPRDRAVFKMRIDGYTLKEIGAVHGICGQSVRMIYRKVLRRIDTASHWRFTTNVW
jgi:DNA-directed RNA polymerase sigma subunit (sigma70/sigma32)